MSNKWEKEVRKGLSKGKLLNIEQLGENKITVKDWEQL